MHRFLFSNPRLLRLADAEANLGESEVREALLAKAEHFVSIGDRVRAPCFPMTCFVLGCARH